MTKRTPILYLLFVPLLFACAGLGIGVMGTSDGSSQLENGSFSATFDGHSLHYEVHGRGPALMTVPNSWGLSLDGLRAFYRPLEEAFTLVYFDPRGIGESSTSDRPEDLGPAAVREDFDRLRQHLGLERVHAIGWSNGAMNLILLAAEEPEILTSATFVHGAASFTAEDGQRLAATRPEFLRVFGAYVQAQMDPERSSEERETAHRKFFIGTYLPSLFADEAAGHETVAEIYADVELSWQHWLATQQEMPVFDARDQLPGITVPSLVIAGAHDLMPPEKVQELHDALADSRYLLLEKSGHFGPVEEPDLFAQAVTNFLRQLEGENR